MAALSNPGRLDVPPTVELTAAHPLLSPITVQIPDLSRVGVPRPPNTSLPPTGKSQGLVDEHDSPELAPPVEAGGAAVEPPLAAPAVHAFAPMATSGVADVASDIDAARSEPGGPLFEAVEESLADNQTGIPEEFSQRERLLEIERALRRERPRRKLARPARIGRPQRTLLMTVIVLALAGLTVWMLFSTVPKTPTQQPAWLDTQPDADASSLASSDSESPQTRHFQDLPDGIPAFEVPSFDDISPLVPGNSSTEGDDLAGDRASLDPRLPASANVSADRPLVRRLPPVDPSPEETESQDILAVPDPTVPVERLADEQGAQRFRGQDFGAGRLGLPNTDPRVANHDAD